MAGRSGAVPQKEVRIDPEDGMPRTFEELRAACKDKYADHEIQAYWENAMIRHVGEGIHNVAADPFLTHASQNAFAAAGLPLPASAALGSAGGLESSSDGLANVRKDPFLAAPKYITAKPTNPSAPKDPFATGPPAAAENYGSIEAPGPSKVEQFTQAVQQAEKTAEESLYSLLGPGDPGRDEQSRQMLIMGPFMLYLWVILLRTILSHYSELASTILIYLVALACVGMLVFWYRGLRRGPVSLLAAGALGLMATTAGSNIGSYGYEMYFQQYWWTQTGYRGGFTTASTPALARSDFAVLDFWDAARGTTYNETRVDNTRAAGYKDTDYYCVAPILSPEISGAALVRVNYWAIGINCCQRSGAFTCGDSRRWNAGRGVVMVDGGYPCPSCNVDKFRLAVRKAESMHNLVSANGAMFVQFVQDPSGVELWMLLYAFGFIVVAALLGGLGSVLFGSLMWYFGVGISGPREPLLTSRSGKGDLMLPLTSSKAVVSGGQILNAPAVLASLKRR